MIGSTISHYNILQKLGEGGMGVVYKARDTTLDRTVALKFLPSNFVKNETDRARFLHEARAASQLNHPNVCVVHEIAEYQNQQFIVMEYVEGETLGDKIRRGGTTSLLDQDDVVTFTLQICEALDAAHAKGIIHRDIKPDNIIVSVDGRAKVMDFGLAKVQNAQGLTKTGSTVGTLAYASPEQIQGLDVDTRTDLWSLGVLLYEMATGVLPFNAEHEAAIVYSIVHMDFPQSPLARRGLPVGFVNLIQLLLQKDRDLRPASCRSVIDTLRKIQRGSDSAVEVTSKDQRKSIAVLPFSNLSPDPENEFFSDGITEELTASLSKLIQLRVCSRSMALQYRGKLIDPRNVGRDLAVDVILEGSVRRLGNRVRIAAELTDTTNGFQLWSESYDRQIDDVFAVQDEIARTIIDALQLQLSLSEQSILLQKYKANVRAYDEYLRARYMWNKRNKESIEQAIQHLENAINIDANYVLAYADLALCYTAMCWYGWMSPHEAKPKSEHAMQKAMLLEPNLDVVQAIRGDTLFGQFDLQGAERHYKRALELNPNNTDTHHWFAYVYLARGDFTNAIRENKEAQRLEPLSLIIHAYAAFIYFCMNQLDEALEEAKKSVQIDNTFAAGHHIRAWILTWMNRFDEALASVVEAEKVWGEHNQLLGVKAVVYARKGDVLNAKKVLKQLEDREVSGIYVHPYDYAYIYAALGEKERTFEMLEKASDVKYYWWFTVVKVHPVFESIRNEPRFQAILKKLNLLA